MTFPGQFIFSSIALASVQNSSVSHSQPCRVLIVRLAIKGDNEGSEFECTTFELRVSHARHTTRPRTFFTLQLLYSVVTEETLQTRLFFKSTTPGAQLGQLLFPL